MPRFHIGDPIVLLAKYANLYPSRQGIVRAVHTNSARELFDEYSVEFAGGALETVHDFQAVEDASTWPVVYASFKREITSATGAHTRGTPNESRGIFSAAPFEIDLQLGERNGRPFLVGQITEKDSSDSQLRTEVRLSHDDQPVDWVIASDLGEFEFSDVPSPATVIELLIRQTHRRILVDIPGRKG